MGLVRQTNLYGAEIHAQNKEVKLCMQTGGSDTWRHGRGTCGGIRERHVEAWESDAWGHKRVTRGEMREVAHVDWW